MLAHIYLEIPLTSFSLDNIAINILACSLASQLYGEITCYNGNEMISAKLCCVCNSKHKIMLHALAINRIC